MCRPGGPSDRQPLPEALVSELLEAGISRATVLAMERWKAQEVLELLRSSRARELPGWDPGSGEVPSAAPFAPQGSGRSMVRFSTQE